MDPRRLRYLSEMGITVWERRDQGPPAATEMAAPAVAATPVGAAAEAASSRDIPPPAREDRARVAPAADPSAPVVPVPAGRASSRELPPEPASPAPSANPREARIALLDWGELAAEVKPCALCPDLVANRTQTVFGVGNRKAEWMVIGEAPGADEDRQGEPFVGKAGQLLNAMLLAIGLPRETVFIANILKCRPPNNRDPRPDEVANCIPHLTRQIALVRPRLILCVGRIAAQNLLRTDRPIGRLRGQHLTEPATGTPVVVTYHPAYLLRSPGEKRKAWEDLKLARGLFAELKGAQP